MYFNNITLKRQKYGIDNDADLVKKTVKKRKLTKSEPECESSFLKECLKSTVDKRLFQHFNNLVNEEQSCRINASLSLLQHLNRKSGFEKQKELHYTLKRLVRGCGASTNNSRAGFFTALVTFLINFEEISNSQVFESLDTELRAGSTIVNKYDSDAIVGKILVCAAIMRSGRVSVSSEKDLCKITMLLLQATNYRTYHSSLGYAFLIEFLKMINEKEFECQIWPYLSKELFKPWTKQTMQSVHCLICIHKVYPLVVTEDILKTNFGGRELLNTNSFQFMYNIFWERSNVNNLYNTAFDAFGSHIATESKLTEFWKYYVDKGLEDSTKPIEIITLRITTVVLKSLDLNKTKLVELMSENFMKMLIEGLKALKRKKDETLQAFYDEYFEALLACYEKLECDKQKVAIIKRFILPPGSFNIEKFTKTRIIHQLVNSLGEDGVKEIFDLFKEIFLGVLPKKVEHCSEEWFHFERSTAGYIMQYLLSHNSVKASFKWREKQLRFLLTGGLFHVTNEMKICKVEESGSFSKNFGYQCLKIFYSSLCQKLVVMKKEKKLLLNLVNFCNEIVQKNNAYKYIRIKNIDHGLQHMWSNFYTVVAAEMHKKHKTSEMNNKTEFHMIFHILLLNMGLQYFIEPEMASQAIEDLIICMQRIQNPDQSSTIIENAERKEPKWIEVVIDLFLHLLSQNTSALRNVVNKLFPFLCDKMNLNAIHQILSMLDMKDGQNPLSLKGGEDEVEDINEEESDEPKSDDELNSSNDETDSETISQTDSDIEEQSEEEGTAANKLKNAISQALMETGAVGADSDMESIDLNELTEEQGKKIDEALASAFKVMKKSASNSSQSNKSKSYKVRHITVMHFRIRVLDLIDIYIQQKPSLYVSLEIMLALFNMMEYCIAEELKPLQVKVEKVLYKLISLKNFTTDIEIEESSIVDYIRLIIESKTRASAFEIINRLKNRCIIFLIEITSKIIDNKSSAVQNLCKSYVEEFIESRNAYINITLLSDIFRLRIIMVWELAITLTKLGASINSRIFRRIQTYEILSVLYKNYNLQNSDTESAKKNFKQIDKLLTAHIKELATAKNVKYSLKEYQQLLEFLLIANKTYARLQMNDNLLTTSETINFVQHIRCQIRLESMHIYQRYCATHKIKVIQNDEISI